ncbi:hypothetical protein EDC96DRAFT_550688 [Choanephora cucurbitarum]|nr:hypothetical protein EDC96DRAFT_550688 [Choanephora cucurbitarum]
MNTFKTSLTTEKMSNEKLRAAVKLASVNKPYLKKGSIGHAWRTGAQRINTRDVVRQQRVDNTTGSNQTSGDFEEACLTIVAELDAKSQDKGKQKELATSELRRKRNGQVVAEAAALLGKRRKMTTEEASSSTEDVNQNDVTVTPRKNRIWPG